MQAHKRVSWTPEDLTMRRGVSFLPALVYLRDY